MCNRANGTYCPIPVGGHSLVTALFNHGIFEVLEVISVPRKEHARKVDLSFGLEAAKSRKAPNVHCSSGPYGYRRGLNETRKHREATSVGRLLHTIVEGAILNDGRDEGNVGRNGRHHLGIMGNLADTLRASGQCLGASGEP